METEVGKENSTEQQFPVEPKKSKRRLYSLIVLGVAVIIYFLVPSGKPSAEDADQSDINSSLNTIANKKVTIDTFEYDSNTIRKSVISGTVSNHSDAPIESIEFKADFSDNAEFVTYEGFIKAGETRHEFSMKVTGHKSERLNALSIRSVQKAK